ncbi:DNA-binding response regulator, NarL/FixJ family, contains REC and HTH domains [Amycolatopsis marina]|uniref:DNA-binding response regulator, NarL/FixJ family, contains REC and HTH domains n=1 Tax=Amycolatopsis marina TaxID=490629 RepID=A0A1I0XWT0_9PSEU|nr:DNA-binding response regulator, NarL/FixJ family, contains REC and HTH domains [Amycolatopsis marina]
MVGEAGTGTKAVQLAKDTRPDVIVMDIRMPDMDGIEATRQAVAGTEAPRVLVLTMFDEDEHVYAALRAGASGFLIKDMALEETITAIRVIAAGQSLTSPSVTRRLIANFVSRPQRASKPREVKGITQREREVLGLVGLGMSNNEIATRLNISAATAKAHVARLFTKLDARDRVHLVIIAYEAGLVTPSHPTS